MLSKNWLWFNFMMAFLAALIWIGIDAKSNEALIQSLMTAGMVCFFLSMSVKDIEPFYLIRSKDIKADWLAAQEKDNANTN